MKLLSSTSLSTYMTARVTVYPGSQSYIVGVYTSEPVKGVHMFNALVAGV